MQDIVLNCIAKMHTAGSFRASILRMTETDDDCRYINREACLSEPVEGRPSTCRADNQRIGGRGAR